MCIYNSEHQLSLNKQLGMYVCGQWRVHGSLQHKGCGGGPRKK